MILARIATEHFRNLAPGAIEFHPAANLIVGRNGQGKTNLLEAIYFLATSKSFRTTRLASLFRFGATTLFAGGAVVRDGLERSISAGLEWGETRKRVLLVNGERAALSAYVTALTVFAYSSARLAILRGAPEERRRFLDRGIASVDPSYLDTLARYGRVLRQRNALLQRIATGEATTSSLDLWDEEFVSAAAPVHRARAAYATELAATFGTIVAEHGYHVGGMTMTYRGAGDEEALRAKLSQLRRAEIRARTSLAGPQRDTLEFLVDGRAAEEVLSGGEMKMIVLFLKFAKIALYRSRTGESPLFLLDDLDAELDHDILQRLLLRLPPATQVFATSAKERFLQGLEAGPHRRLVIESGRVTARSDLP
ncbi:MAG TPA: DNA replication and repair protein RecF [Thermoanaerobaculia bacterium]|nr:DNA replication and repair protein RecF [Thermoanaerobaculia bacterium]